LVARGRVAIATRPKSALVEKQEEISVRASLSRPTRPSTSQSVKAMLARP
jgi:hypothetical protein